ncbi:MAG TPA: tetratricopeptide repeat protein, partial [Bacteroidota bacterium]|nr:tetratricopeptide repeat protein [Bacteroidota bacterium]
MRFSIQTAVILSLLALFSVRGQNQSHAAPDTALARALFERGNEFQNVAKYDTAIVLYDNAASLFLRAGNTASWVRSLNAKAQCLEEKGSYDKVLDALRIGTDAEQILLNEAPEVAAQRLLIVGVCYRRQGKFDSSLVAARAASHIGSGFTSPNRALEWDICSLFAGTFFDLGEHDSALAYNHRALQLLQGSEKEDQLKISSTYNSIAGIYETRGDYEKALDYFVRSIEVRRSVQGEKHPDIAALYNNIAAIYMRLGDNDLSVEYYLKSLSIMNEVLESDNPAFGIRYNNISMAYRSRGEFDKALEAGNKSKAIFVKKLGATHPNVGGVINNIGRTYSDMKKYDRALGAYQEALAIWEPKLGQKHPYVTQSYFNIGEAYGNLGDFAEATSWLHRSLAIRRETLGEKNAKVAQTFNALGKVYADNNQPDTALQFYQKALVALVEDFNDVDLRANPATLSSASDLDLLAALAGKAGVFRRLYDNRRVVRDLNTSMETYELAAGLVESIRRGFGTEGAKLQLGTLAFDVYERAVDVAVKLSEVTNDASYLSSAFEFAERSKAGVLLDAITEADARKFSGIPDSLLQREAGFRSDLSYFETQIQKEKDKKGKADQSRIARWENAIFDTHRQYASLTGQFERSYPGFHSLRFQTSTVRMEDVQKRLLDDRSALLEYVVADSSATVFVVTRRNSTARRLQFHAPLDDLVKQFRRSIQNLDADAYVNVSSRLYKGLLEPARKDLKGIRRLTIIPDGVLNYLPFEALLSGRPNNPSPVDFSRLPYLIRDFEISYQLSARLLEEHTQQEQLKHKPGFVAFAPVFAEKAPAGNNDYASSVERVTRSVTVDGKQFAELKESANEVNDIARLFAATKHPVKTYLYNAASETALKSDEVESAQFLHIATHGMINEDKP